MTYSMLKNFSWTIYIFLIFQNSLQNPSSGSPSTASFHSGAWFERIPILFGLRQKSQSALSGHRC